MADPKKAEDFKGKFAYVDGNCLTASADGSHHNREITDKTTFMIDGKAAKLTDLIAGDNVVLSGSPLTSVVVTREKKK